MVGKLGVASFNPLLFALIREAVAGPLLLAMALCLDGALVPLRSDMVLFTGMGICIFTNQAFFIIGDKLAGPVISSSAVSPFSRCRSAWCWAGRVLRF